MLTTASDRRISSLARTNVQILYHRLSTTIHIPHTIAGIKSCFCCYSANRSSARVVHLYSRDPRIHLDPPNLFGLSAPLSCLLCRALISSNTPYLIHSCIYSNPLATSLLRCIPIYGRQCQTYRPCRPFYDSLGIRSIHAGISIPLPTAHLPPHYLDNYNFLRIALVHHYNTSLSHSYTSKAMETTHRAYLPLNRHDCHGARGNVQSPTSRARIRFQRCHDWCGGECKSRANLLSDYREILIPLCCVRADHLANPQNIMFGSD